MQVTAFYYNHSDTEKAYVQGTLSLGNDRFLFDFTADYLFMESGKLESVVIVGRGGDEFDLKPVYYKRLQDAVDRSGFVSDVEMEINDFFQEWHEHMIEDRNDD